MIQSYFDRARAKLKELSPLIKSEALKFDMVSADMGILKGMVVFWDGSVLDFRELLSSNEHDYRFHWMDSKNRLIIRWDSAPHYKDLDNFPFHEHEGKAVKSSKEMSLMDVLDYIKKEVVHKFSRGIEHER